jgi:RNA polymerase sigma factor (sigma-70 family)
MPKTAMNGQTVPFSTNEAAFYEALKAEDRRAYAYLYQYVHDAFVPLAMQRGGSYDEALDVLNDCLAVFLQKVRDQSFTYQPNARITTYLYSVCFNQWHNYVDKRSKRREVPFDSLDIRGYPIQPGERPIRQFTVDSDSYEEATEQLTRLTTAMSTLRDDCRNLLTWFYVNDCSLREIASRLNLTEASATVKRFKCAKYLRDRYQAART